MKLLNNAEATANQGIFMLHTKLELSVSVSWTIRFFTFYYKSLERNCVGKNLFFIIMCKEIARLIHRNTWNKQFVKIGFRLRLTPQVKFTLAGIGYLPLSVCFSSGPSTVKTNSLNAWQVALDELNFVRTVRNALHGHYSLPQEHSFISQGTRNQLKPSRWTLSSLHHVYLLCRRWLFKGAVLYEILSFRPLHV